MAPSCQLVDPGKPSFSLAGFLGALAQSAAGLPDLLSVFLGQARIDPALREGVMVSVSRMNRCRHCTAIHSAWGEAVGLEPDGDAAPREPLASAARYACCLLAGDDPSHAERALRAQVPESAVRQVAAVARLIDFANRCGNTWDAFEARLGGRAPEGSSLADELGVLFALAPFGAPFLLLSKLLRARRGEPELPAR